MAEERTSEDNLGGNSTTNGTRLTAFEDGALKTGANPSSTITWFSGGNEQAAAVLQDRLEQVLALNAWLSGRIAKRPDGNYYLEYTVGKAKDHWIQPPESLAISKDTPFQELGPMLANAGLILRFGYEPKRPLFLMSVVPSDADASSFAVIFSMSHILGDGHTFYKIYNMIMTGKDMEAMQADRIDIRMDQIVQAMGKTETGILSSFGFIMTAMRGLLQAKLLSRFIPKWKVQTQYWLVDAEKMKVIKKEAATNNDGAVPFVSTNDVLTSWFLRHTNCQHGMMAINLRGRLDNYTHDKAGNYENLIFYRIPDDCASPVAIRQSLTTLKRTVTTNTEPTRRELTKGDFSIITNWSTFVSDQVDLGNNCHEMGHLPVYDYSGAPSSIAMGIIFRYAPGQLAVLALGTSGQLEGLENPAFASDATINCHF